MDEHDRTDEGRVLSLRLEVHLDRRPISGRLHTVRGAEESGSSGWLGFVDAPKRFPHLTE